MTLNRLWQSTRENKITNRTKQGSLRPFTRHSWSYFSFFLEGQTDFTKLIPAWVFLISQYGESVSIIILSIGMPLTTSRFSVVFREQPFTPVQYQKLSNSYDIDQDI